MPSRKLPSSSKVPGKPSKARLARAARELVAARRKRSQAAALLAKFGASWSQPGLLAGVDEAGRGPLCGPVVAAAVVLNDGEAPIVGLADSKALSPLKREALYQVIMARALCVGVGQASVQEIDELNILHASMLAMQRAVAALRLPPHRVVVDGNRCPSLPMTVAAVVKGDAKIPAISAASIIAKVVRDRLCNELHARWPGYGFDEHKGYPTALHLERLRSLGPCPEHRRSYAPVLAALEQQASEVAGAEVSASTGSKSEPKPGKRKAVDARQRDIW